MEIKKLSNKNLLAEIKSLATTERKVGLEILKYICEIERRKCYIDLGYSSLFVYLTKELNYDEGSAYRKIESAKLLIEYPELEEKIVTGKITPTNLTILATTLKKNNVTDKAKKLEILNAHENKSKIELQKSLFQLFGSDEKKSETKKQVSPTEVRISLTISEELQQKIDRLKSIKNKAKVLSTAELLEKLVDEELAKEEKRLAKNNKKSSSSELAPVQVKTSETRYIPSPIKKAVWQRAEGKCEWPSCNSIFYLQYDHVKPFSLGGKNSSSNIRLLCANHNLHSGIRQFGLRQMRRT